MADESRQACLADSQGWLCQPCLDIVANSLHITKLNPEELEQRRLINEEEAAAKGCYICTRLRHSPTQVDHPGFPLFKNDATNRFQIVFTDNMWHALSPLKHHLTLTPAGGMPFTRDLPGNFGVRLDDAKKWLQTCLSGHFQCHATHNSPGKHKTLGLPTRLVEVLIVNESLHARVRSFSDQDQLRLADQIRYLTLSHCWGAQPSSEPQRDLRLKSNNIDDLSRSIPIEELGQLFQDALYVTLHLGYQYIWIDSLCIVQDQIDKDDWEYEAHRMADYYDNSVLTIMASAAKDGNDRLFPSQKLKSLPFPVVKFATPEMNKFARKRAVPLTTFWTGEQPAAETIRAHEQHDEFYVVDLYSWNGLADGPLADRAWVLQEELSSKRILYFGNDQMYWECGMTASETWPVGFPKSMSTLVDGRRIRKNIQYLAEAETKSNSKDKDTARFYSSVWFQIIEEYTRRRLSFDSDRLPAIWGIMDRIGKYIEDREIHGFRASDLIRSLLWRENPLDPRLANPDIGRAPSWSWASLNSQVSWPHWLLTAQEEPYMLFKPDWKDKTDRRVLVAKGPLRSVERNQLVSTPDSESEYRFRDSYLENRGIHLNFYLRSAEFGPLYYGESSTNTMSREINSPRPVPPRVQIPLPPRQFRTPSVPIRSTPARNTATVSSPAPQSTRFHEPRTQAPLFQESWLQTSRPQDPWSQAPQSPISPRSQDFGYPMSPLPRARPAASPSHMARRSSSQRSHTQGRSPLFILPVLALGSPGWICGGLVLVRQVRCEDAVYERVGSFDATFDSSRAYWRFKDWLKTNLYENEYLERHNNGDYVIHIR